MELVIHLSCKPEEVAFHHLVTVTEQTKYKQSCQRIFKDRKVNTSRKSCQQISLKLINQLQPFKIKTFCEIPSTSLLRNISDDIARFAIPGF